MTKPLTFVPGFTLYSAWLPPNRSHELLAVLWKEMPWRQRSIRIFGSMRKEPRLTAWCSDPGVRYAYSGVSLEPDSWHPQLALVRGLLQTFVGMPFNSVLLNAYRDGNDSMGWHADDEAELGRNPCIASLSLGSRRRFLVREKRGESRRSTGLDLCSGDLLVMDGESQHCWQHALPRTRKPAGLRINLTFRQVLP